MSTENPIEKNKDKTPSSCRCCQQCTCRNHHIEKWLKRTSIDGVHYVFMSSSIIRRIVWGIILVCLIVLLLYTVADSIALFIEKPISTSTTYDQSTYITGLAFPAVTICSLNTVMDKSIKEHNKDLAQIMEYLFNPDLAFGLKDSSTIPGSCDRILRNLPTSIANVSIWDIHTQEEHLTEFVKYCGFVHSGQHEVVQCKNEMQLELTPLGICYTFNGIKNGIPDRHITSTGARQGLKMVINVDDQQFFPFLKGNAGIKVIVHERDDIARPTLYGIAVPPGSVAYIGIQKRVDIDKTTEGNCMQNRELSFYPQYKYSVYACRQNALVEHMAKPSTCGCVLDPNRPPGKRYANIPDCTFNDSCCLLRENSKFDEVKHMCLPPCHFKYYSDQVTYTDFPLGSYLTNIAATINISNKTDEEISKHLISLHVYFQNIQVNVHVTHYTYTLVILLSHIGGQLSLFLGASIISLFEVGVLTADIFKSMCCRKKQKTKEETSEADLSNDQGWKTKEEILEAGLSNDQEQKPKEEISEAGLSNDQGQKPKGEISEAGLSHE